MTAITPPAAHPADGSPHASGRTKRLLRGPDADPRWARPALGGLLALTALLYLVNLSRNGWANDFYSAAVDAGTRSWKAFFFGSFDSSSFITVDKTPASLWVMEISGRIFGVNSWSMLGPQALEGVACVGVLYAAVRRWFGPAAGLIAGLVMALTPVAALMFRFNNPDALLVLLLTVSAYAVVRALENGRSKWLVLAGVVLGFAFLAKMLQAFLVVPAFALAYLWAGPPRLRKRVWQLLLAGAGVLVGGGWWVLVAEVVPAADRPYFGGSTNNNILQLAIGYNGLGRLTGSETGSIGGGGRGGAGGGFGGATGITRLFSAEFGGQISWLLPAALICLAGMLWVSRRAARTDRTRAAALLWGGWLVGSAVVFSYMSGIIHPYYMVALAPAIAALVSVGAMALWERRLGWFGRIMAAVTAGVTVWWAVALLDRSPSWLPWLRWVIVVAGVAGAGSILVAPWLTGRRGSRGLAGIPVVLALVAGLTGPAAYAIDTVATTHTGSLPTAGPQTTSAGGPGRGAGFGAGGGAPGGRGTGTGGPPAGRAGGRPGGTTGGTAPSRTGAAAGGTGGPGGLSGNTQVSSALVKLLENGATGYTWVAATVGSQEAAPLELATGGEPVMAIGGFNGTDPSPTLAAFKALVAEHKIHYFIGANSQSFGGGQRSSAIASWVASHFTKETVGGTTVYDLTKATSS